MRTTRIRVWPAGSRRARDGKLAEYPYGPIGTLEMHLSAYPQPSIAEIGIVLEKVLIVKSVDHPHWVRLGTRLKYQARFTHRWETFRAGVSSPIRNEY